MRNVARVLPWGVLLALAVGAASAQARSSLEIDGGFGLTNDQLPEPKRISAARADAGFGAPAQWSPSEGSPEAPSAPSHHPEHGPHREAAKAPTKSRGVPRRRGPLDIPSRPWAAGTAWEPADTPAPGHRVALGGWNLLLHYNVFAGLDVQGSRRGEVQATTMNWVAGMAQHALLGGQLRLRTLLSLEAPFLGARGYPLLLQTGETADRLPLVDRQHPHDLFVEVALHYARSIGNVVGFEVYAAPVGEPALGPAAFPNRLSASADPTAPLSHHWLDSTYLSHGVVTAGFFLRRFKVEGSAFNGHEPDEHRYGFDRLRLDSQAVRATVNPTPAVSAQVSYGHLNQPQTSRRDQHRITASLSYYQAFTDRTGWATTLAVGMNRASPSDPAYGALLESQLRLTHDVLFGRIELVQKSSEELDEVARLGKEVFPVGSVGVGYAHYFGPVGEVELGLGAKATVGTVGAALQPRYGTRWPVGAVVFVQLRPGELD